MSLKVLRPWAKVMLIDGGCGERRYLVRYHKSWHGFAGRLDFDPPNIYIGNCLHLRDGRLVYGTVTDGWCDTMYKAKQIVDAKLRETGWYLL